MTESQLSAPSDSSDPFNVLGDLDVNALFRTVTQNTDLRMVLLNLKNRATAINREMNNVISVETNSIVDLGENLLKVVDNVERMIKVFGEFKDAVNMVNDTMTKTVNEYSGNLATSSNVQFDTTVLNAQLELLSALKYVFSFINNENISIDNLQRELILYSLKKQRLASLKGNCLSDLIDNVEKKFQILINRHFLKGIQDNDRIGLVMCLRMYNNLDKPHLAELYYREKIVRPRLCSILNERNLSSNQNNLDVLYDQVLTFLYKEKAMFEITQHDDLKNYNFQLNSFWVEFDKQCREGLPNITAPGDPELFQKRYKSTWAILKKIAVECTDKNLRKNDQSFQDHILRFNLPVYYEIVYQQIAGGFETVLSKETPEEGNNFTEQRDEYQLTITLELVKALSKCLSEDVFIKQLADQFLKMSMFLISRYLQWIDDALKECLTKETRLWETFFVKILADLSKLLDFFASKECLNSKHKLYSIFPEKMNQVVSEVVTNYPSVFEEFISKFSKFFVDKRVDEIFAHMQQVSSVPRLYRKTNRNPPKEAGTYMVDGLGVITKFYDKYICLKNVVLPLNRKIILKLCKKFKALVQEVVESVSKTEESLRRLKNSSQGFYEEPIVQKESPVMSDEMKIREQLRYDIKFFAGSVEDIVGKNNSEKMLSEMLAVVD